MVPAPYSPMTVTPSANAMGLATALSIAVPIKSAVNNDRRPGINFME
jgi:hypothetical protein